MALLNSDEFWLNLYNRFPPKYREDDLFQKLALKRYLQATGEGGFSYIINDTNALLGIKNSYTCRSDVLLVLLEEMGFTYFNGIPEKFLRFLLPQLEQVWENKGSALSIDFMISALTGIQTELEVGYDELGNTTINVRLLMDYAISEDFPDSKQFYEILKQVVPFYCGTVLLYVYFFHDEQSIFMNEDLFLDRVTDLKNEYGFIPYAKGSRYSLLTNILDRNLNDDFILCEEQNYLEEDPDVFWDTLGEAVQSDSASIQSEKSKEYFVGHTNVIHDLLNKDFVLNDYAFTDFTEDRVVSVPLEEGNKVGVEENRLDEVKIDTDLNGDMGAILAEEVVDTEYKIASEDKPVLVTSNIALDRQQGLFTNIEQSTIYNAYSLIPDVVDVIHNSVTGQTRTAFMSRDLYVLGAVG